MVLPSVSPPWFLLSPQHLRPGGGIRLENPRRLQAHHCQSVPWIAGQKRMRTAKCLAVNMLEQLFQQLDLHQTDQHRFYVVLQLLCWLSLRQCENGVTALDFRSISIAACSSCSKWDSINGSNLGVLRRLKTQWLVIFTFDFEIVVSNFSVDSKLT